MKKWLVVAGAAAVLSGCAVTGVNSLPASHTVELPPVRSSTAELAETRIAIAQLGNSVMNFNQQTLKSVGIKFDHLKTSATPASETKGLYLTTQCIENRSNPIALIAIFTLTLIPDVGFVNTSCSIALYENGVLRASRTRNGPQGTRIASATNPLVALVGAFIPGTTQGPTPRDVQSDPNYQHIWQEFSTGEVLAVYAEHLRKPR